MTSSITNSARTEDLVLNGVVANIKKEIKQVCSEKHGSILADNHQAVKQFTWETIWCEVNQQMPSLVKLLSGLVDSRDKKPMLCLMISMILKSHCKNISLAISVFLYGNGVTKQVIDDTILHIAHTHNSAGLNAIHFT